MNFEKYRDKYFGNDTKAAIENLIKEACYDKFKTTGSGRNWVRIYKTMHEQYKREIALAYIDYFSGKKEIGADKTLLTADIVKNDMAKRDLEKDIIVFFYIIIYIMILIMLFGREQSHTAIFSYVLVFGALMLYSHFFSAFAKMRRVKPEDFLIIERKISYIEPIFNKRDFSRYDCMTSFEGVGNILIDSKAVEIGNLGGTRKGDKCYLVIRIKDKKILNVYNAKCWEVNEAEFVFERKAYRLRKSDTSE